MSWSTYTLLKICQSPYFPQIFELLKHFSNEWSKLIKTLLMGIHRIEQFLKHKCSALSLFWKTVRGCHWFYYDRKLVYLSHDCTETFNAATNTSIKMLFYIKTWKFSNNANGILRCQIVLETELHLQWEIVFW